MRSRSSVQYLYPIQQSGQAGLRSAAFAAQNSAALGKCGDQLSSETQCTAVLVVTPPVS